MLKQIPGPTPRVPGSVGLGWGPRIRISEFPGEADAGLGATLGEPLIEMQAFLVLLLFALLHFTHVVVFTNGRQDLHQHKGDDSLYCGVLELNSLRGVPVHR